MGNRGSVHQYLKWFLSTTEGFLFFYLKIGTIFKVVLQPHYKDEHLTFMMSKPEQFLRCLVTKATIPIIHYNA